MLKKILIAVAVLVITVAFALVIVVMPYLATPKIRIENISTEPVQVTAMWRDKEKLIGEIRPGSIVMFEINDEAAMSFNIVYADGTVETTTGVYFTAGTKIYVQINSNGVEVNVGT